MSMGDPSVTILCSGDIHLGRHPSCVAPGRRELSVGRNWERMVQFACDRDVDLVVLTGDIVDRESRFFEALGPLEAGIRRLVHRGISTYAVAGNHDFDVLSRLNDLGLGDQFRLLGEHGQWERVVFERQGQPRLELVGWSFPDRHVEYSPLSSFPQGLVTSPSGIPSVGLLHADLEQPGSQYAPVSSEELVDSPVDTWLLGHIHRPSESVLRGGKTALYPGSLQPLDPGEPGVHGPWLVEIRGEEIVASQQPLATVRYRTLDVDVEGINDDEAFKRRIPSCIRDDLPEMADQSPSLRQIVYRLRLRGRTTLHARLRQLCRPIAADYRPTYRDIEAVVDEVAVDTVPDLDLNAMAVGDDPPAVLAQLILRLQSGELDQTDDGRSLWTRLGETLDEVRRSTAYAPLLSHPDTADAPDATWVKEQVIAEGLRLLDALLINRDEGSIDE